MIHVCLINQTFFLSYNQFVELKGLLGCLYLGESQDSEAVSCLCSLLSSFAMGQRLSEDSDDKEIDVAELQEWYKKFVIECPSGTLYMHEFKSFFGVTENPEAADYIENMFRAFDKNGVSY